MKRPLLKILPGVAVVLLSTSCSKDNDNAVEDNTTIEVEKVAEKQVFYLKVNNESSLSKMTVEGLGGAGKKVLKFEYNDLLTIRFDITFTWQESSSDDDNPETYNETYTFEGKGEYMASRGEFYVSNDDFEPTRTIFEDYVSETWKNAITKALEEMQTGGEGVAAKYNVQLKWGNPIDFSSSNYHEYSTLSEMFAAAPRSADKCFTLKQKEDYCFVVFEGGCTKEVTIGNEQLKNSKCYIVASGTDLTVKGETTNTITTASGKLYYVRMQAGDVNYTLTNPDAGKANEVDL